MFQAPRVWTQAHGHYIYFLFFLFYIYTFIYFWIGGQASQSTYVRSEYIFWEFVHSFHHAVQDPDPGCQTCTCTFPCCIILLPRD